MPDRPTLNRLSEGDALRIVSAAISIRLGLRGDSAVLDEYEFRVRWHGPADNSRWWSFRYRSAKDPTLVAFWAELNDVTEDVEILDVMTQEPDGDML